MNNTKFDIIEFLKAVHEEWPVPESGGTHSIQLPEKDDDPKYVMLCYLFIRINDQYRWLPMQFEEQDLYKDIQSLIQEIRDHVKELNNRIISVECANEHF